MAREDEWMSQGSWDARKSCWSLGGISSFRGCWQDNNVIDCRRKWAGWGSKYERRNPSWTPQIIRFNLWGPRALQ